MLCLYSPVARQPPFDWYLLHLPTKVGQAELNWMAGYTYRDKCPAPGIELGYGHPCSCATWNKYPRCWNLLALWSERVRGKGLVHKALYKFTLLTIPTYAAHWPRCAIDLIILGVSAVYISLGRPNSASFSNREIVKGYTRSVALPIIKENQFS